MESNSLIKLSLFVDENKRKIQNLEKVELENLALHAGLYGTAFIGLCYALRSVRPVKKFVEASQIPESFVKKRMKLNGKVINVEIGNPILLRVDHNPVFFSKWRRESNPGLGVEIAGLNVSSNGISWLQHILIGGNVHFILLKKQPEYVTCIVNTKDFGVAENLLKIGFASVKPMDLHLQKVAVYAKYYGNLLKLEDKAERNNVGVWKRDGLLARNAKYYLEMFLQKLGLKKSVE